MRADPRGFAIRGAHVRFCEGIAIGDVEVLSPDGARYLSGRERLAARLTPTVDTARVEFFVDECD